MGKKKLPRKQPEGGAALEAQRKSPETGRGQAHHWRKPLAWSGGVVTAVLIGVLISVLSSQASRIIPQPSAAAGSSTNSSKASPKPASAAPAASTARSSSSSPRPSADPLTVISEDPVNVDNLGDWVFPGPLVLSAKELRALNSSKASDPLGYGVANFLYARGGYESQEVDTQLVVQNNQSVPLRIINMSVIKSCTSPLRGTLFLAPPQAGDFSIRMGFNLDSPEPVALEIHGNQIPDSAPYYFADYTVSINPGAQQVFDLFAQALNHACTFRYRATILEGKTKVYQVIGDGNEPFRVSGLRNNSAYSVMYAGGIYSPFEKGQYVRANPKTCCHVS